MTRITAEKKDSVLAAESSRQPVQSTELATPKLTVILPVRNEPEHLSLAVRVFDEVIEIPTEILVVYDSPLDTTVAAVMALRAGFPHLRALHNSLGPGVINAIRTGFQEARGDYILIAAVDDVSLALAVPEMIALMIDGCDLVSATRYAYGGRRLGGSLRGRMLSRTANFLLWWFGASALTDSTTGGKMLRCARINEISLESDPVGWAVVFEMAIKAQLLAWELGEVPIISVDRLYGGQSSFRLGPWVAEYLKWFWHGFRELRRLNLPATHVRVPRTTALQKPASRNHVPSCGPIGPLLTLSSASRTSSSGAPSLLVTGRLAVLVLLPDEAADLVMMSKFLKAAVDCSHEVIVVCDASAMGHFQNAQEIGARFVPLLRPQNSIGEALTAAVEAADSEYVLIFGLDETGPIEAIGNMVDLMDGGCDFVSGTRYASGGRRLGGSLISKGMSMLANKIFHEVAGCVLTDSTTGMKMFRREAFGRLHLETKPIGWAVTFEMSIRAQLEGMILGEVPIVSIDRLYGGKSTFKRASWVYEYLSWFLLGIKRLRAAARLRSPIVRRIAACRAIR